MRTVRGGHIPAASCRRTSSARRSAGCSTAHISTGELDKFRTRVERTPTGSDVYISHRGMKEVYTGERKEHTIWQPRPTDPQLEAEFLSRLMVKLGATDEDAGGIATAAAAPPAAPAAGPRPDRPPRPDPAGRRQLRSRLAPGRPGARPQRLHGRGPRPRARACTSFAMSTRHSPAARSPASLPGCSASARKTTARARPSTGSRSRPKASATSMSRARCPGQARKRRSRQAHRRPAARRPEVAARRAGTAARDAFLQHGQRQRRQRHRRRGVERHQDDAAADRLRLFAQASSTPGWPARPRRLRPRCRVRDPRARRPHRLRPGAGRARAACRCG